MIVVGVNGHHALELDSRTDANLDSQPCSYLQLYNALLVGGSAAPNSASSDDQREGIARLREGTGGEFGNIVLANVSTGGVGVLHNACGSITVNNGASLTTC